MHTHKHRLAKTHSHLIEKILHVCDHMIKISFSCIMLYSVFYQLIELYYNNSYIDTVTIFNVLYYNPMSLY